jgi:hypothetical protein
VSGCKCSAHREAMSLAAGMLDAESCRGGSCETVGISCTCIGRKKPAEFSHVYGICVPSWTKHAPAADVPRSSSFRRACAIIPDCEPHASCSLNIRYQGYRSNYPLRVQSLGGPLASEYMQPSSLGRKFRPKTKKITASGEQ